MAASTYCTRSAGTGFELRRCVFGRESRVDGEAGSDLDIGA